MLELAGLAKRFQPDLPPLFAHVSLRMAPGEVVAVRGESGVGKSTLLNCIAGLDTPDAGTLRLDGVALEDLSEDAFARLRRERYGFVFQAFHILPHLSLRQNVALPLWLLGQREAQAGVQADAMLARVGLGGREHDWPRVLSGGELQRVAIARALIHKPRLVLADEPTGNLDPDRAGAVLDLLLATVRETDAMAIIVTHSMAAATRADRIVELRADGLHPVLRAESGAADT